MQPALSAGKGATTAIKAREKLQPALNAGKVQPALNAGKVQPARKT